MMMVCGIIINAFDIYKKGNFDSSVHVKCSKLEIVPHFLHFYQIIMYHHIT